MSPVTMPQLASRLGVNVEHVGFAARLGRLPQPIGRDCSGYLLFDADVIDPLLAGAAPLQGRCPYRKGARI